MKALIWTGLLCCCWCVNISIAQFYSSPVQSTTTRCINPNQRNGVCVSINDCQTLWSVLQRKPLSSQDEYFLRASECQAGTFGFDVALFVCCTADTGFTRRRQSFDPIDYYWQESQPSEILFPRNDFVASTARSTRVATGRQKIPQNPTRLAVANKATLLPQPPTCGGVAIGNRIYGGDNAELFEFPWMVLFEYKRKSGGMSVDCAGSLITQRYVVTAAHCVKGAIEKNRQLIAIRLGEHDTSSKVDCNRYSCAPEAFRVGIEETIPHELYNDQDHEHDIALVRLERNVHFSDAVKPICLPSSEGKALKPGAQFTVAGWGQTLKAPSSAIKQKLKVALVDQEKCRRRFRDKKVVIKDTQICAGGKFAEDSCKGDSGGPLMHLRDNVWVLEGIVSFGNNCGLLNWPAVHTRVASYVKWIRKQVRA